MESCLQFNQKVNKPSHTFLNTLLGSQSELLISDSVICERLQLKSSNRKGENIKSNLKFWALLLNENKGNGCQKTNDEQNDPFLHGWGSCERKVV